jgi:DNA-binding NtrC family response regulator/tetratricopeptide (TPR) repeat protein
MDALGRLLGDSRAILAVRDEVTRILRSAASSATRRLPPILILGETGTGKGLLADAIHRAGPRADGPFVDVNCAAIPETLLEAELFGYERGAFTDARHAKVGLFQAANGGTIFLDEIGLLPAALQAKLLRILEERSVRRLGATRSEPLDVCVVAATSEDLPTAAREGRFRADLYHRLAVLTLSLPPLRGRGQDVITLAEHFLARVCEDYGLPRRELTDDARAALLAHAWPGNVRELANVIERAALLADDARLTAERLGLPRARMAAPAAVAASAVGTPATDPGEEGERRELLDALRASEWNLTRAAAALGLPRNTLRYRMDRLGVAPEDGARRRGGRPPLPRPRARVEEETAGSPSFETRRVTFLDARLVRIAPEDVARDDHRAVDAIAQKVTGFGGQIEDRSPTGVLAAFGLEPEEDAPRRAAHAAIVVRRMAERARSASGAWADVKVALHAQSAVVARAGRDGARLAPAAREEARPVLDALLAAAPVGSVVASGAAARLLATRFDLRPLPAAGSGACHVVRHAELGRTRFVGRDRELRLLLERFELAQGGQGQVVRIVGEPGIGKSRLLHELRRRLGAEATWVEGQALSFGGAMPFHPVVDMLRRVFRIDDADPEASIVEKIERGLERLGGGLVPARPVRRYVLSVDPGDPAVLAMDARLRRAEILRASHALLERGAERRPHVVVLEDAHWCDPATEEWIARLGDGATTKRVLLILTYRPGYRPPFGDRSFHTGLALSTLPREETLRLARELLGAARLPPELETLIVDKAEGNPFFVEELVRSLEEAGAVRRATDGVIGVALARADVPDTVDQVILARIQRLDGRPRELLEIASVIGRSVPVALLRAVAGGPEEALADAVRALETAEFLNETRVFPELELTFKHALTQDVAYANVAPERRRMLHAAIVEAIEALYPDRVPEHVERLAHHALRGELWPRAVRYFRAAGEKAFDRSANREAVSSFEQALEALRRLPEDHDTLEAAIDIRLTLRSALLQLGRIGRITQYLREAEALALRSGDRRRQAWVWTYMTISHLFSGEPRAASAVAARALALAREGGDIALLATARTPLAHACRELGDYRRAIELFGETIRALTGDLLRQRLGQGMPPSLYARSMAAVCLAEVGDFAEAERLATESVDLAQTMDLPFGLVLARVALGYTALVDGRLSQALDVLDLALTAIRERDIPTWFPWAAATRGYALALSGSSAEGVTLLEAAIERAVSLPVLSGHSQWLAWLAHAHLLDGRRDEAARLGEEALRLCRERGERGYEAWALYVLGLIDPARCPPAETRSMAAELGMTPLAERCRLALGGRPSPSA